jgi:hypothetical protein
MKFITHKLFSRGQICCQNFEFEFVRQPSAFWHMRDASALLQLLIFVTKPFDQRNK